LKTNQTRFQGQSGRKLKRTGTPLAGSRRCLPAVEPKALARSKRHQLSSFVWGIQKAQKITEDCTCQVGGYQMIMLIHLENRSNHSLAQTLNIVTSSFACLQRNCQMMTFTPTLCPQTFKPM